MLAQYRENCIMY